MRKINMNRIVTVLVLAVAIMAAFCVEKHEEDTKMFVVDGKSRSAEAAAKISDLIEVDLIELSAPDSLVFSLGSAQMKVHDRGYMLYDYKSNAFYNFDKEGRLTSSFARKGGGPEEYNAILDFTLVGDEMYLADFRNIKIYDLHGRYLRAIDYRPSRPEMVVAGNGDVYLRQAFNSPRNLIVLGSDGKVKAELFPPVDSVLTKFEVPAGAVQAIGKADGGVYFTRPLDQKIYLLHDTVAEVIAEFDFGSRNVPADLFHGSSESIEQRYHGHRSKGTGFVYFDDLLISPNWIEFSPVGTQEFYTDLYADRRTGEVYHGSIFPPLIKAITNKWMGMSAYDPKSDAFVVGVDAYVVADALAEADPAELAKYPALAAIDPETIDPDAAGYILLMRLK